VTFNTQGGMLPDGVEPSAEVNENNRLPLALLPIPVRPGFAFDGWFTESVEGERITENTAYSANTVIYAHWTQVVFIDMIVSIQEDRLLLINSSDEVMTLRGMYLTDDPDDLKKWRLPALILRPDSEVVFRGVNNTTTPVLQWCTLGFDVASANGLYLVDEEGSVMIMWTRT
jgi:uncharacterized repeat protein (TIGR02543 family)